MTKEDVPFRAMLALTTFKKTGKTPDVEFFESGYFQKAANEANSDEMAGYGNARRDANDIHQRHALKQFERMKQKVEQNNNVPRKTTPSQRDIQVRGGEYEAPQPVKDYYEGEPGDPTVQTKIEAYLPGGTGLEQNKNRSDVRTILSEFDLNNLSMLPDAPEDYAPSEKLQGLYSPMTKELIKMGVRDPVLARRMAALIISPYEGTAIDWDSISPGEKRDGAPEKDVYKVYVDGE